MTLCKVVGLNLTEAVYYCCNWHTLVLNDLRVLLKLAVRHCNLIIDHEVVSDSDNCKIFFLKYSSVLMSYIKINSVFFFFNFA